jgi:hypothetical protein
MEERSPFKEVTNGLQAPRILLLIIKRYHQAKEDGTLNSPMKTKLNT